MTVDVQSPHPKDRVPADMFMRLDSSFARAVDRVPLSSFAQKGHWTTTSESIVLQAHDGTFDVATPVSVFSQNESKYDSGPTATVENVLDGPVAINSLGGHASWTILTDGPHGEREFVMKEGIAGDTYTEDNRPSDMWSDDLYESAVRTLAVTFLTGNIDLYRHNFVISRDRKLVCIDHDYAERHRPGDYDSPPGNLEAGMWTDVLDVTRELATELAADPTQIPETITDRRREIITHNVDAYASGDYRHTSQS